MKNTISVFVGSDEFICQSFYDIDVSIDGVEVFDSSNKPIGSINGLLIPGIGDEDEEYAYFNGAVEEFLKQNYYK